MLNICFNANNRKSKIVNRKSSSWRLPDVLWKGKIVGLVLENGAACLSDGGQGCCDIGKVLERNQSWNVEVVAMLLAGQFGVVVVGLVLRKALAVVHFPELEKTDAGRFGLVLFEVFEQVGQLR